MDFSQGKAIWQEIGGAKWRFCFYVRALYPPPPALPDSKAAIRSARAGWE